MVVIRCSARRRCGLHAWNTARAIHILHHAYQLGADRGRSTAPGTSDRNAPASGVSYPTEIIGVERHDGDAGLPSDPVGHRSSEHVPPPPPYAPPQQNEVSALLLGNPHDFGRRPAYGHHRVYARLTSGWYQGVELPARYLTEVMANQLPIERSSEALSARIAHVPEEGRGPPDGVTADRRPPDHVEQEDDASHRSGQLNAGTDRSQRRFREIRGH
jgi:hypothetical protein